MRFSVRAPLTVGERKGADQRAFGDTVSAILIETVLIGHLVAKLARFLVYRPFFKHEEACIAAHTSTSSAYTEAFAEPPRPPGRFIQRIVGPPPPLGPPPSLPDYNAALRQGARQDARRQAAHLGVSAGRRGREQFGSGDPEDLEVERIKRLGGLPPSEYSLLALFDSWMLN